MFRRVLLSAVLFFPAVAHAGPASDAAVLSSALSSLNFGVNPPAASVKGWDHLARLLIRDGVPQAEVVKALSDPRMPYRTTLVFGLQPRERHSMYRKHNSRANRVNALKFYLANKEVFTEAKARYGVPESLVLSILQVETACGRNTGNSNIFPPLARLANATESATLEQNIAVHGKLKEAAVLKRAAYLESTFLPQAVAAFRIAKVYGIGVHDLRGSFAGALGLPQFLPRNILDFGVDADADGRVLVDRPADAIHSAANYLSKKGWKSSFRPAPAAKAQRAVIWEYNRSAPYIDTVLTMAGELSRVIDRGVKESDLVIPANARNPRKSARAVPAVRRRAQS